MQRFIASLSLIFASLTGLTPQLVPIAAAATNPTPVASVCFPFPRSLGTGTSGTDVRNLQLFLNSRGFLISSSGPGAPGSESTYFGAKTKFALAGFQAANGVFPVTGYLGPLTRARIQTLCATAVSGGNASATEVPRAVSPQIQGSASGNGLSSTVAVLPPPSDTVITAPPATATSPAATIEPRSIVGVTCYLSYEGQLYPMKASGVIVHPQGYVLTARHAVDPRWTATAYAETLTADQKAIYGNSTLHHCDVGLPDATTLPSASQIRSSNPSMPITQHFQYGTSLEFVPERTGLSFNEYENADFAVLRITGATFDCASWNANCAATTFPYTPVLGNDLPRAGTDEILSYGYPSDHSSITSFHMKGAVGVVNSYFRGDLKFVNDPQVFSFGASDIRGGRSGSPLFFKGRVMGILFGSTSLQESYNLTITSIREVLKTRGMDWILRTS